MKGRISYFVNFSNTIYLFFTALLKEIAERKEHSPAPDGTGHSAWRPLPPPGPLGSRDNSNVGTLENW
jgi:hypothetical protein